MTDLGVWAMGFASSLALIAAIGAQNTMLIRTGVRREHVGVAIAMCLASDILLISAGTAGMGALFTRHPGVMEALAWIGAAYLAGYAVMAFRSAIAPKAITVSGGGTLRGVVTAVLAATYLNPQAYLDTLVLLGNMANQHGDPGRWVFTAGALTASTVWFVGLGLGARALAGPLSRPRTWRWIDTGVGVMMTVLAIRLLPV